MLRTLQATAVAVPQLASPLTSGQALEVFLKWPELSVLPVSLPGERKGLFFTDCLSMLVGCANGHACHSAIPGNYFRDLLVIDVTKREKDAIAALTRAVEDQCDIALYMNTRYIGMLSLKQIVAYVHRAAISEAITNSALTGLPGTLKIHSEFKRRSEAGEAFVLCHIDANDFKPYNDKYGIARGDIVLQFIGDMLLQVCGNNFVGHVGGDDFVIMCPAAGAEDLLGRVCTEFDAAIGAYYDAEHRKAGYIMSNSRSGVVAKFPLMALSLSAMHVIPGSTYEDATRLLAALKKHVKELSKEKGGSVYEFERRQQKTA